MNKTLKADIEMLFRIKKSKYKPEDLTDELLYCLYEEAAYEAKVTSDFMEEIEKFKYKQLVF